MMKFLGGLVVGILAVPLLAFLWFKLGNPPVAVADKPLPFERRIVRVPLHTRIDREMPRSAPIEGSEDAFVAGARVYRQQCSSCHGAPGRKSPFAAHMFPPAPQLWEKDGSDGVGVSDDPVGETYWKVRNGIRLTGMPAYDQILNDNEMWQVSLLLANANKPLPDPAVTILKEPLK